MTYRSFLYPPQIHLEQKDPFNLAYLRYFEELLLSKLSLIMSVSSSRFKGSSCSGWISGGPLELPCSIKYGGPLPWYLMSFRLSDWLVAPLRLSSIDTLDTIKAEPESFRTATQLLILGNKMTQENEVFNDAIQCIRNVKFEIFY